MPDHRAAVIVTAIAGVIVGGPLPERHRRTWAAVIVAAAVVGVIVGGPVLWAAVALLAVNDVRRQIKRVREGRAREAHTQGEDHA
jgi:hypothetical protein